MSVIRDAGIEGKWENISKLSLKDFDDVMNINVRSMWLCSKFQIENMKKNKRQGAIINIASIAGIIGFPNETPYAAAKHAVIGLTKGLALKQIGSGIRVNAIAPGGVDTEMFRRHMDPKDAGPAHPIGRLAEPSEM